MVTALNVPSVGPQPGTLTECVGEALSPSSNRSIREVQFQLAAKPAIKILVPRDGWYRVTQPELLAAGLPDLVDSTLLRLFVEGIEQPLRVTGVSDGGFGPKAAIEFYGRGQDGPYSDKRVYWLAVGDTPGKRIHVSGF